MNSICQLGGLVPGYLGQRLPLGEGALQPFARIVVSHYFGIMETMLHYRKRLGRSGINPGSSRDSGEPPESTNDARLA